MFIPPTSQNSKEFDKLLKIYRLMMPKRVLEIGTHEGGTLFHWLQNASDGAIVASIDVQRINECYYNEWKSDNTEVRFYTGLSQEDEAIAFGLTLYPIDWLFIDGGHSYNEVKSDYETYGALVKPGGVIAFHDIIVDKPYIGDDGRIFPTEVKLLWDEIKGDLHTTEIVEPHDEWGSGPGIGVIFK